MAGRLHGTADGRPVSFVASGSTLTMRTPSLRAAWRLRRVRRALAPAADFAAHRLGVTLRIKAGLLPALTIQPGRPITQAS